MKVQELLNKDNWIKGTNAENIDNKPVNIFSPDACKWCIWGAIIKCYMGQNNIIRLKIEETINGVLTSWNDEPGREWQDIEKLIKEFDL